MLTVLARTATWLNRYAANLDMLIYHMNVANGDHPSLVPGVFGSYIMYQLTLLSLRHSPPILNKLCWRPPQYAPAPCKLMPESRVTWATSVPILVFLGLSVIDLGPMYATD